MSFIPTNKATSINLIRKVIAAVKSTGDQSGELKTLERRLTSYSRLKGPHLATDDSVINLLLELRRLSQDLADIGCD
jgi:hypothetical protein